ncbi:MAG: hypothetical protein PHD82_17605, partial [Candidatus Riflebacteria bacterium]|nr:hypothetical protein [Candidatus Riflebacteria bacterium]
MADKNINIRRRLSLASLTLAWFTVFAVPAVMLQFSLDYLFEITLQANRQAALATLSGEMNSFRRDLTAEAFVERKLHDFFAGNRISNEASATLSALEETTGLKVAAVVTHSADLTDVDTFVAPHARAQLPVLPRHMLRRYLSVVNHYHTASAEERRSEDLRRARKDADTFLRRQFGLIVEMPLEPERACRIVSAKLGGPAFFFYMPGKRVAGGSEKHTPGCLVVLRGLDLDMGKILADSAKISARGIIRSFSRLKIPLDGQNRQTRSILTDYVADQAGQHLVSTFPDTALVDLIQACSLAPVNLDRVLAHLPLLKVTVPLADLQHPLATSAGLIFSLARLIAIIGAV